MVVVESCDGEPLPIHASGIVDRELRIYVAVRTLVRCYTAYTWMCAQRATRLSRRAYANANRSSPVVIGARSPARRSA